MISCIHAFRKIWRTSGCEGSGNHHEAKCLKLNEAQTETASDLLTLSSARSQSETPGDLTSPSPAHPCITEERIRTSQAYRQKLVTWPQVQGKVGLIGNWVQQAPGYNQRREAGRKRRRGERREERSSRDGKPATPQRADGRETKRGKPARRDFPGREG